MIINTFGCSYTHGITPGLHEEHTPTSLRENWVEKLALRYPEHTFNNYAVCNASVEFSINQLLKVKQNLKGTPHINIFQITLPARLTFWDDKMLDRLRYSPIKNLTQYSNQVFKHMQRYNTGWIPMMRIYEDKEFFDQYYKWKSLDQFYNEYLIDIEFVKNNSDFYFFWKNDKPNYYPSILGLLTQDKLEEYSLDDVYHFNKEGNNFIADWICNSFLIKRLQSSIT